jgi:hypothetical protein
MDIYSLFGLVSILVLLITFKITSILNRKYLVSIRNKIISYISGLISSIIIVALFYGTLQLIFHTPTHIPENLGCFTFTATNIEGITRTNGKKTFYVVYTTNETDKYNSFVNPVSSKEEGQELVKNISTIEKQIFIDSTSTINYVDKNVTEKAFITQKRKWIYNWIIVEIILLVIVISLNVLIRKRKQATDND